MAEKGGGKNPPKKRQVLLVGVGAGCWRKQPVSTLGNPGLDKHVSRCPSFLRFERLTDAQSNYSLMFLSSTRWVAVRLELMTNLMTLVVALFVAFSTSFVSHSYKAMAVSFILQVRKGLGHSGGSACGLWADLGDVDYFLGFGRWP